MKRLSNKYGKNSRNNKFLKILHLQREKAKKGFVKSPNVAQIAKVTEIFLAKWKDWVTNVAKIARITNLTKSALRKRKGQEGLREVRKFWKNHKSTKVSLYQKYFWHSPSMTCNGVSSFEG